MGKVKLSKTGHSRCMMRFVLVVLALPALVAALWLGLLLPAYAQSPGTVKSHQKISDTAGEFTSPGSLDDSDRFGVSAVALGDLDGDGVTDLAVGARWDDDGGTNRGAVWALFLNSDGTVKSHQKISDTDGGFTGALDDDDRFGRSVTALGDLDGDGVTDLAVGAYWDDDGGTDRGAVWLLFLNPPCTWTGTIGTDWAEAGNWTDCAGGTPGGSDAVSIPNVANQPILGSATNTTIGGLTIQSGATVTISGTLTLGHVTGTGSLTVGGLAVVTGDTFIIGTLTNIGEMRQTRSVTGFSSVTFLGAGCYGDLRLFANGLDLGSTTVSIMGDQDCTNVAGETVKRCFDITPTNATGRDATITFYFDSSEIPAGQSCSSLNAYHWNGSSWDQLTLDPWYGTGGRSCGSDPQSIRVKNVASFSPFVLAKEQPTAICYDLTGDNQVTLADIQAIAGHWRDPALYDPQYDVAPASPDGVIDIVDVMTAAARWGEACP